MSEPAVLHTLTQLLRTQALFSHFQPIIDLQSGQSHGHEALIRTPPDSPLGTPQALYQAAADAGMTAALDLHCCRTHLGNFAAETPRGRLFMNLCPAAVVDGSITGDMILDGAKHFGLPPHQLVIEITEHAPVSDYARLRQLLDDLRLAGVEIAIDDLGSGYSGLRQWSELQPQYVKIDSHFVRGVHASNEKRQFIHSIVEIARTLGSRVVAEGIETQDELHTLQGLGVHYGQGYLLGRPSPDPSPVTIGAWRSGAGAQPPRTTQTVSSIVARTPAISPDTTVAQAMERFDARPGLRCLVVCEHSRPRGMLTRSHLTSVFASRYGRDLFSRRPVRSIMQTELISVETRTPLDELSERLTSEYDYLPEQDLVVTDSDGQFMGTASFTDLLRAITDLQIRSARYANPLTQLPGSVPINERIDQLLAEGLPFHFAYCDLDNFKPFNDHYGYARGDEVLRHLATMLQEEAGVHDLVGHVGGDDFILLLRSKDWEMRCQRMLQRFAEQAPEFYDPEHRAAGGIQAQNRRGESRCYGFLSMSIGVTQAKPHQHGSHMEIAAAAAEVKHQAKQISGNSLFVDRRHGACDAAIGPQAEAKG